MKYLLIFALTLFQFGFSYSQHSGGRNGGGGGRSGQDGPPPQRSIEEKKKVEVIKINDVAGLITYDSKIVIKETKVKKEDQIVLMTELITEYNQKIREIEKANKVTLETIEITSLEKQKKAIEKQDYKQLMEIGNSIEKELKPIQTEVFVAEEVLNTKIESAFSAKIYKKWMTYFEGKKEALQPKKPKDDNNNSNSRPDSRPDQNGGMR